MKVFRHIAFSIVLLTFFRLNVAGAQYFAPAGTDSAVAEAPKPAAQIQRPVQAKRPAKAPVSNQSTQKQAKAAVQKTDLTQPPAAEDVSKTPAAFQLKFIGNDVVIDDNPRILMYMRDFKIERNLNGGTTCTMRFYVFSNIKEKITNISYRLKWPKIETALSFDDIQPGTATYFDYALLGSGCYSMDKAPNITVNRCRVKGMSQADCSNAIQWLN